MARQQQREAMQAQLALAQQWAGAAAGCGRVGERSRGFEKQREIYVGNLAMNIVTSEIVAEVFNSALSSLSQDGRPPWRASTWDRKEIRVRRASN